MKLEMQSELKYLSPKLKVTTTWIALLLNRYFIELESENRRMRTLSCTSNFSSSSELSVDLEEIEVAAVDVAPVKIHATYSSFVPLF